MNSPQPPTPADPSRGPLFRIAVAFAILLCLVSCTFFLLIPTQSINVDTVYEGF